jgi:hypothetical protein
VEEIAELNRADQDRLDRMPTQAERRVGLVLSGFLTLIFSCCAALRDLMVTFTPDFKFCRAPRPPSARCRPGVRSCCRIPFRHYWAGLDSCRSSFRSLADGVGFRITVTLLFPR